MCVWHRDCISIRRTHFPSFPISVNNERGSGMMKTLTKLILMCAMAVGLSVVASAQKGGDDPKKPKPPPPVINPAPPKPKGDDKPKKPRGAEAMVLWVRTENTV